MNLQRRILAGGHGETAQIVSHLWQRREPLPSSTPHPPIFPQTFVFWRRLSRPQPPPLPLNFCGRPWQWKLLKEAFLTNSTMFPPDDELPQAAADCRPPRECRQQTVREAGPGRGPGGQAPRAQARRGDRLGAARGQGGPPRAGWSPESRGDVARRHSGTRGLCPAGLPARPGRARSLFLWWPLARPARSPPRVGLGPDAAHRGARPGEASVNGSPGEAAAHAVAHRGLPAPTGRAGCAPDQSAVAWPQNKFRKLEPAALRLRKTSPGVPPPAKKIGFPAEVSTAAAGPGLRDRLWCPSRPAWRSVG